jgi:hypothetical protein
MLDSAAGRTGWNPALWPVEPPAAPVWNPVDAAWIVSRYRDVQSVLQSDDYVSPDASSEVRRVARRIAFDVSAFAALIDGMMFSQNGATHRASRAAVLGLMPPLMARWTPRRIGAAARELVGALPGRTVVDLIPALVDALPNLVAADMLGIDRRDFAWLRECAVEIMSCWRPAMRIGEYARVEGLAREVRAFLRDGTRQATRIPIPATTADALELVEFTLIAAAVVTTSGTLGGAIHVLAQHVDLQEELCRRPERLQSFMDEILRMTGGVRRLGRRLARRPVVVGGVAIPSGAALIPDIERAGRDPAEFANPDMLDLARRRPSALAFGGGSHPCMGPRLAKAEIAGAVESLLARFVVRPAGQPTLRPRRDFVQFERLNVRLDPRER